MKNILLIKFLLLFSFPILAQNYGLNSMFGSNGIRTLPTGKGSSSINDIEVDLNKKVFTLGSIKNLTLDVLIIKKFPNGTLDNSFGNNGRAIIDLGGEESVFDMALQSDGKIIICGTKSQKNQYDKLILMRVSNNGSLDKTFGVDGVIEFSKINGANVTGGDLRNLRIQPDGKIVVVGQALFSKSENKGVVQRYNINGTLDSTFGKNGTAEIKFSTSLYNYGQSLHIMQNGKILVLGSFYTTTYVQALTRLNDNGKVDSTFGVNGVRFSTFTGLYYFIPQWINEMPNGDIVTMGYAYNGSKYKIFVSKYIATGQLKTSFGNNGIITHDASTGNAYAYDACLHSNGDISIPAETYTNNVSIACVLRLDSLGSLVSSFGVNGISKFNFGSDDYGSAIYADGDSLYLAGGMRKIGDRFYQGFISKLNQSGNLISSFGTSGLSAIGSGNSYSALNNIIPSTNGSFYVTGVEDNIDEDQFIVKIDSNGNLVSNYGNNGVAYFDNGVERLKDAIKLDNERVLLASESTRETITFPNPNRLFPDLTINAPTKYSFCVIDANGNPDTSTQKNFRQKVGEFTRLNKIRKDSKGRILVSVSSYEPALYHHFINRHNADFSLDTSFSKDGKFDLFGSEGNEAFIADFQITPEDGFIQITWANKNFDVVKYNENGTNDANFGSFGRYTSRDTVGGNPTGVLHSWKFGNGYYIHYLKDGLNKIVHLSFDGKISTFGTAVLDSFLVGDMQQLPDSSFIIVANDGTKVILYHYFANGTRDMDFNKNGVINSNPFAEGNVIRGMILNPDNSVILCHQIINGFDPAYIGISKYSTLPSIPTGVSLNQVIKNINAYPNPFTKGVNIDLTGSVTNASKYNFSLTDMNGRLIPITIEHLSDFKLYIETPINLPQGVYVLYGISNTNETIQQKLIKY